MPSVIDTTVGANYLKNVRANGLGPRTVIVKLEKANMTDAELNFVINYVTTGHGSAGALIANGNDAFVVAGLSSDGGDAGGTTKFVSGQSDVVYLALQGTGTVTKAGIEANDDNKGFTATVLCEFDQNYQ